MADRNLVMRILLAAQDRASAALNRIRESSTGLTASLARSQRAVRDLERAQKDLARTGEVRNQLRATSTALADVRNRQRELTATIRANGGATRAQQRELAALARRGTELQQTQARQRRELQELTNRLRRAGVDSRNLAEAQARLRRLHDQATDAVRRQTAALERRARAQRTLDRARQLSGSLQGISGKAAIGGAVATAALSAPVRAYAAAESAGMDLRVAMMDSSGQVAAQFAEVDRLATRLGDRLPGTTADFKNLMTMLIRQGMRAETILGGTGEAAALLAVQLKKTPQDAAEMAAKLQDATRGTEQEMLAIMDGVQRLFYAGVEDGNILGAFAKMSPALDIIKVKGEAAMKMMGPLVGMLDQAGLSGESAGNALRKVFGRSMAANDIEKKLNKMKKKGQLDVGFTLDFTDGKGEFGGLDKMYAELTKLRALNTQQRLEVISEIYGDDAETLQALNVMIDKGKAGYEEFAAKLEAQASLNQRVNEQLGTLSNLWDAASGTFTNFLVGMGEAIAPELKNITEWLGSVAEKMSLWAQANPGTANTIMKVAAGVTVLLLGVSALSAVAAAVLVPMAALKLSWVTLVTGLATGTGKIAMLAKGFGLVTKALGVLKAAALANPVVLVVAAIAAAAYLLWRHWDTVTAAIARGWAWLDGVFARYPILNYIFPFIGVVRQIVNNWSAISGFFSNVWARVTTFFSNAVSRLSSIISGWSPLSLFQAAMQAVINWFSNTLPVRMAQAGRDMVQGLVNGIKSALPSLQGAMQSLNVAKAGSIGSSAGAAAARRFARGYSRGGYTGAGGVHEAAGVVHKGEVVFSQADVRRFGGWRVVENLRRSGGQLLAKAKETLGNPLAEGGLLARTLNALMPGEGDAPLSFALPGAISMPEAMRQAAAAPARNTVQQGGNTYNITVNVPAGSDGPKIGQDIAAALAQHEAAQHRRRRGRLLDKD